MNENNNDNDNKNEFKLNEPVGNIMDIVQVATTTNPVLFFITKYWHFIVIAVLAIIIAVQYSMVGNYKSKVEAEKAKNILTTTELATCSAKVTQLNTYINDLSVDSVDIANHLDEIIADAVDELKADNKKSIQDILTSPTPKDCSAAMQFIRENDRKTFKQVQ